MIPAEIKSLNDLRKLRTAPDLDRSQSRSILNELRATMDGADWFTIGIMASSANAALCTLKEMETHFKWPAMNVAKKDNQDGPVFLKANQKTGDIYIRVEHGLGEGILLSCQYDDEKETADTFGPFPLNFFKNY